MTIDTSIAVSRTTFVAIDFETTGLYPATDRIVEFGAVTFRGETVIATFDALANPGMPISPDAAAVSGISDADVRDAPPVAAILPRFVEFVGTSVIVAHNAPFDVGFLRAALHDQGDGALLDNPIVDTQALAVRCFPRRRSYALQNLAAELGLPQNRAHRALDDATMCMRLFNRCVAELSFMGDLALGELLGTR